MNAVIRQLIDFNEYLDFTKQVPKQLIDLAKQDKVIKSKQGLIKKSNC